MTTTLDPEHLKARARFAGEEAERWKLHHIEAFTRLAEGTTVIFDLISGQYVTGETWQAADDAFEQRFGAEKTLSHSFTVGRPTFIGGGLWLKCPVRSTSVADRLSGFRAAPTRSSWWSTPVSTTTSW